MKRLTAIGLSLALLLCACGAPSESAAAPSVPASTAAPVAPASENEAGYIIPIDWNEQSINDGTWGYVTAAAELPGEGVCDISHVHAGYLVRKDRDQDTAVTTLTQYAMDGTQLHQLEIPPLMPPEEDIHQYVGRFCFGESSLWLTAECIVILDEETGDAEDHSELQQWDYEGNLLTSVPLSDYLSGYGDFLSDMALDDQGNPMLIVDQTLQFCDSQGQITATAELTSNGCDFCQDAAGRTYIQDVFENQVCTIRWDSHTLGDVVLTTENIESVLPGGGDYDFLLSSNDRLRGVNLSTGTITEILSWADWDLAGNVANLAWLDEETFLITVSSLLSDVELLTLTRVPADQMPEKTILHMAAPLSELAAEYGSTWVNEIDQMLTEGINQFNRGSSEYRVEVETFSSAGELNLRLVSGDIPDLLFFDQGSLEQDPDISLLAKKGYLADLQPLFDADPELSTDDFIPSILELAKRQAGGLYTMPLEFYFTALFAQTEYVGDRTSWTISDMLSIAQTLPEDMCLWAYLPQWDLLDTLLRSCVSDFIDTNAGTCNFETQEFYDLLTLCRDYCPAEVGEDYEIPSGGSLITAEGGLGSLTMFYKEYVSTSAEQGRTLVGYPNTGGGLSVQLYSQLSIMAQAPNPDGAWAFFRTLFTYDHQSNRSPSVRLDAFDEREARSVANGNATEAECQAAKDLILSAQTQRLMSYPCDDIILEEAAAFFAGDKSAQETAQIIQNRVSIYLGEQS